VATLRTHVTCMFVIYLQVCALHHLTSHHMEADAALHTHITCIFVIYLQVCALRHLTSRHVEAAQSAMRLHYILKSRVYL